MRYRKVSTRVFVDVRFRALSEDGQFLWLCLLCAPQTTNIGALPVFPEALAAQLGKPPERVRAALDEIAAAGMAEVDLTAGLIVLPSWFKHNAPGSLNAMIGMMRQFEELPDSPLVLAQFERFAASARTFIRGQGKREIERTQKTHAEFLVLHDRLKARYNSVSNPSGGVSEPVRTQDQDQDQNQEQEQEQ